MTRCRSCDPSPRRADCCATRRHRLRPAGAGRPAGGRGRSRPPAGSSGQPLRGPPAAPRRRGPSGCIFLYMPGGPSHVDLFDPKPRLATRQRQAAAVREAEARAHQDRQPARLAVEVRASTASPASRSASCSRTSPSCIDDICVIRSMYADNINHTGAALQMCTGEQAFSRPSMGSWLVYGLGTENQNLPGFVVVSPAAVFQGRSSGRRASCRAPTRGRWSAT